MKVGSRLFGLAFVLGAGVAANIVSAQEITFEDQRGKTITLAGPADSVVIFPKPMPFIYLAIDGGPEDLKGIHPATKTVMLDSIISGIFPALADINTSVVESGFIPNVEEVLKAAPDIVLQWTDDDAHFIEPMERVGIKVAGLGYGTREIAVGHLEIIGKLSGNDDRVARLIDWQTETLSALNKGLAPIPQERRTTMVYIDTLANNEITIFPLDEFFFTAPGLRNLAFEAGITGYSAKITPEQLLAWDPDIIVMNHYDVKQKPSDIYDNPVLSSLKAVKNHRIYKKPLLDPNSHEAPLIWKWMARVGYPEVFDFDLRRGVRSYYAESYGAELTDAQIDGVLNMEANVSSPDYRTLFGG
jgi:iron complex transport system substrate-binding protein